MISKNVDPAEISRFEETAHDWWNPQGSYKALHAINPVRLNFITQYTELKGKRILDIGCGGGILTESFAKASHDSEVIGIDLAEASLVTARAHAKEHSLNIEYRNISAEDIAKEQPGTFDIISCMEMLEHVPDPASIIQACQQLCKTNGHVFFSTINRTAKSFALAIVSAEYILGLIPKGTHKYENFIKPSELAEWSRKAGLELQHISGIAYKPINNQASISNNVDVNYIIHTTQSP